MHFWRNIDSWLISKILPKPHSRMDFVGKLNLYISIKCKSYEVGKSFVTPWEPVSQIITNISFQLSNVVRVDAILYSILSLSIIKVANTIDL